MCIVYIVCCYCTCLEAVPLMHMSRCTVKLLTNLRQSARMILFTFKEIQRKGPHRAHRYASQSHTYTVYYMVLFSADFYRSVSSGSSYHQPLTCMYNCTCPACKCTVTMQCSHLTGYFHKRLTGSIEYDILRGQIW